MSVMREDLTVKLDVVEGDGDAARSGYWTVTGPQDEREMYGQILLARMLGESAGDPSRVAYVWDLYRRPPRKFNAPSSNRMRIIANGETPSFDASLEALRDAWWVETVGHS